MGKEDLDNLKARIEAGEKAEQEEKMEKMKKTFRKKRKGFVKDFRKFITKGNVVDLAVAVVIGAAFNAIVNGLVKYIINPVISLLTGGISLDAWKTVLHEAVVDDAGKVLKPEVAILWGEWVQTIINFFIIALCIFVAVRMITRATNTLNRKELEAKRIEEEKKKAEEKEKERIAAEAEQKKAEALAQFYRNVEHQTELLEKIAGNVK